MPEAKELTSDEIAFLKNLGFRIQYLRKKKELSQAQLAEMCDLSNSTISHLESTTPFKISLIALYHISKALDVEPKTLLDFD